MYISDKGSLRSMYTLVADPRSLPKTMIMMGQVSVRPAYYQVPLRPAYYIDGRNNRETSIKRFLKGLFRKRN